MQELARLVSQLRVAYIGRKTETIVKRSRFVESILNVLTEHNYISGYEIRGAKIKVLMRYANGAPIFNSVVLASTSRKSVSATYMQLRNYSRNQFVILSTKQGVISRDRALLFGIGGVVLLSIF